MVRVRDGVGIRVRVSVRVSKAKYGRSATHNLQTQTVNERVISGLAGH